MLLLTPLSRFQSKFFNWKNTHSYLLLSYIAPPASLSFLSDYLTHTHKCINRLKQLETALLAAATNSPPLTEHFSVLDPQNPSIRELFAPQGHSLKMCVCFIYFLFRRKYH